MDKDAYYTDGITITLDAYNTTTIDSVNWSDANNAVFSIDGITLDSSYVEFEDTMPEVAEIEDMCKEYPALEKTWRNFKTTYDLVKQDWKGKQDDNTKW
jgi:hypothetical protein